MLLTGDELENRPEKVGIAVAPGSGARKDRRSWTEPGPAVRAEREARAVGGGAPAGGDPKAMGMEEEEELPGRYEMKRHGVWSSRPSRCESS